MVTHAFATSIPDCFQSFQNVFKKWHLKMQTFSNLDTMYQIDGFLSMSTMWQNIKLAIRLDSPLEVLETIATPGNVVVLITLVSSYITITMDAKYILITREIDIQYKVEDTYHLTNMTLLEVHALTLANSSSFHILTLVYVMISHDPGLLWLLDCHTNTLCYIIHLVSWILQITV